MKVLGIIPARGGSKGIPNKNIRLLSGIPLIAHTIKAAKESKLLGDFIVSTDCINIKKVSETYGAKVYDRNKELASDNSPIEPTILELLDNGYKSYDILLLLQPTAPIRNGGHIDDVISMFFGNKSIKRVISVVALEDIHPSRMYTITEDKTLHPLSNDGERLRRQELSKVYLRNGSIYAITTEEFIKTNKLIGEDKHAYVMPEETWANIDTERDFLIAEFLMQNNFESYNG